MQIRCTECGRTIPAADINLDLVLAKCSHCDNVFSFADKFGLPPSDKPTVEQPKGIHVENWGTDLTITYRWYDHSTWLLVLFCLFWDGVLVAIYSAMISQLLSGKFDFGLAFGLLFPLIHVAVGLGLTYTCAAMFLNRTTIRISRGDLHVSHGPLPYGWAVTLLAADVQQLYCVRKEHRNKNSTSYTYDLNALLRSGVSQTLVKNISRYERARFLEQQIEQHLVIDDQRVAEEASC